MGASFLITLREGLEISLVLAIVLAYLAKTGRRSLFPAVAVGAGIAALVCLVAGAAFHLAIGEFEGKAEQAIEGTLAIIAAAVLTWMIFWMRKNARSMSAELHGKLDAAADSSSTAVALVAFGAVAREGFETVLFLLGAETGSSSGASVVVGGLLGLAVSAVLGVMVYRGGRNLNLRRFFQITGALLILFAAGLFAKAVHEFRELLGVEGWLAEPSWLIESGPFASGWFYDFLAGVFGWSSDPERVRVIAYFAYLVPVSIAFFAGGRRSTTSTTTTGTPTPQVPASV
jgi:high-affinity iron transporter